MYLIVTREGLWRAYLDKFSKTSLNLGLPLIFLKVSGSPASTLVTILTRPSFKKLFSGGLNLTEFVKTL